MSSQAVLDAPTSEKEKGVIPMGFHLSQRMPRPVINLDDSEDRLKALASVTYGTMTPEGPDDPADDTER